MSALQTPVAVRVRTEHTFRANDPHKESWNQGQTIQNVLGGKHHMRPEECSLSWTPWVEVLASCLHSVNHSQLLLCMCVFDLWLMVKSGKNGLECCVTEAHILIFSARVTCPATIQDSAVTAARAPMCRNGPVAWTEVWNRNECGGM